MLNSIFERFILPRVPEGERELANKVYDGILWILFLFMLIGLTVGYRKEFSEVLKATNLYSVFVVFTVGMLFTLFLQAFLPSKKFEISQTDVIIRRSVMFLQATIFGFLVLVYVFNPFGMYYQLAKNYADETIGIPRAWEFSGVTDQGDRFFYTNGTLYLTKNKSYETSFITYVSLERNNDSGLPNNSDLEAFFYNRTPNIGAAGIFNYGN